MHRLWEALCVADYLGFPDAMFAAPLAEGIRKASACIEAGPDPLHLIK